MLDRNANLNPLVSVVILTLNEEANLRACLESLHGLDCEVFVVDSGSTDRTCDIVADAGAQVFQHGFENYSAQRNWSQRSLPLNSKWVLHLDADERLTPRLVSEINGILHQPPADVHGFLFRKRTMFMGRWIKHGGHYPSFHLRLFLKDRGFCEERLYDQHFLVNGTVKQLQHDYVDVLTSDLKVWFARHARWAELEAREILHRSRGNHVLPRAWGSPIERRRWLRESIYLRSPIFLRCFLYWFYRYFLRFGFLDGRKGLTFHFLHGLWFRLLIDAKLWQLRKSYKAPVLTGSVR